MEERTSRIPMEPSEAKATSEETFRCWNCGNEFPTNGRPEGHCPNCGAECDREKCRVRYTSNEGF